MTIRKFGLAVFLAIALPLAAQKPQKFKFIAGPKPGGGEVKWSVAEHGRVELQKDEYVLLELDVKVEYQDIVLKADKVTLNLKTKDAVAEGHVIIDQGPSRISANHVVYNLDTKTGTFFNANATMDPSMYFSGDRIEKVDEDTYRLTNGVFTSCDLDRPAWSFHVGSAEVTMDDYAHMRDISFRARGLPIFWAPILVWPTKKDRSRGFLIPRARFSNFFGSRLETGYFIPVGESIDATINVDLNTKNYFGTGLNLRYLPTQNVKIGELSAYAVNNPRVPTVENGVDKFKSTIEWKYQYRHAQEQLPGGFRGVVDIQDYSNLDFFRDYDDDPRLHTLSNIYSSAYLTKNRPTYSLNILADRRDIVFPGQRQRFEQLPSLQYRTYPQRVFGSPVYFSLESSSSHLRTSRLDENRVETRGADYFRTDIFPTISMQLRTPPWFSIKPQLSLRETYYSAVLEPSTQKPNNDDDLNRFYAQAQVELVGPSFSRVFNRALGNFSKFKHVIEPRFRYLYTTEVEDQDRIIRFDTVDSPFLPIVQDSVEYSLTQRLIGKEKGEGGNSREVMSFSLRQTVALSDPFTSASTGSVPASSHKFTPL
ncbi:MAG TPA: LPS assembly protein LptD, partial [Thermoanaerobaculia bacterium]|nr:LPS assembly protein LptD [Thermoanaerobaculia bacterium]